MSCEIEKGGALSLSADPISRRLIVDRTIRAGNVTLYVFLRKGGKTEGELKRDKTLPRDTAMITVDSRDESTFKLSYYPHNGDIQIVESLGMDQLERAIEDLIASGFPHYVAAKLGAKKNEDSHNLRLTEGRMVVI